VAKTKRKGDPVGPLIARDNAARALQAVPEWQATVKSMPRLWRRMAVLSWVWAASAVMIARPRL
jgi:hypothetical protein